MQPWRLWNQCGDLSHRLSASNILGYFYDCWWCQRCLVPFLCYSDLNIKNIRRNIRPILFFYKHFQMLKAVYKCPGIIIWLYHYKATIQHKVYLKSCFHQLYSWFDFLLWHKLHRLMLPVRLRQYSIIKLRGQWSIYW